MCIVHESSIPLKYQTIWLDALKGVYTQGGADGESTSVGEGLERSWYAIVVCIGTAMIFSPLYMYIMAYFPTYLAYTAIGLINLIWLSGTASGLYLATMGGDSAGGGMMLAAVMLLFAIIFDVLLWCFWPLFKQAIAIVDATAHFFISTQRILLVSLFYFVL